jgi:hypothetical protein
MFPVALVALLASAGISHEEARNVLLVHVLKPAVRRRTAAVLEVTVAERDSIPSANFKFNLRFKFYHRSSSSW